MPLKPISATYDPMSLMMPVCLSIRYLNGGSEPRMLPEITTKDVEYAQKILLPSGRTFDKERCKFIKCLKTADLQAVPGSGKTTALLAKLIILEKQLPFDNGGGIFVISHTNTAVDEITEKLGKVSPNLFVYPSFVGTIQSFVNTFLILGG